MRNATIASLAYTAGRKLWFYKSVEKTFGCSEQLADWLVDYPLSTIFWAVKFLPEGELKASFRRGRADALYND